MATRSTVADAMPSSDTSLTLNTAGRLSMCCLSARPLDGILARTDSLSLVDPGRAFTYHNTSSNRESPPASVTARAFTFLADC